MLDVRSVYAANDSAQFWVRIYVSEPSRVAESMTAYVFVDSDNNPATGRTAAAPEVNAAFTSDPSAGGYEFVLAINGNGTLAGLWEYRAPQADFATLNVNAANGSAETSSDIDPLRISGAYHGYVQARVSHNVIGLTQACNANLYVRTVNNGAGDLDVQETVTCVPGDSNADGIPDRTVPPNGCTLDAHCPGGARCVDDTCRATSGCTTDAQCATNEQCASDGRCLARPGGSCTSSGQCGDLVCSAGQCVPCGSNTQCADGQVCSATGKCTGGVALGPDENVEGGAFNCALLTASASSQATPLRSAALAFAAALVLMLRRRRQRNA
jgi:hypothetical protein